MQILGCTKEPVFSGNCFEHAVCLFTLSYMANSCLNSELLHFQFKHNLLDFPAVLRNPKRFDCTKQQFPNRSMKGKEPPVLSHFRNEIQKVFGWMARKGNEMNLCSQTCPLCKAVLGLSPYIGERTIFVIISLIKELPTDGGSFTPLFYPCQNEM